MRSVDRPCRFDGGPLRRRGVSCPPRTLILGRFFSGYTELIRGEFGHGWKQ